MTDESSEKCEEESTVRMVRELMIGGRYRNTERRVKNSSSWLGFREGNLVDILGGEDRRTVR